MAAPATVGKKPKGLLWTGIILIILGIAGCGGGCGALVSGVGSAISEANNAIKGGETTPYGETVALSTRKDGIVFILASAAGASCTARNDAGRNVSVTLPSGVSGSTTENGSTYHLVGIFPTDDDHTYQVTCNSSDDGGFVAVRISGTLASSAMLGASVVGIFAGAGLVVLGLILFIAGLVARSRWKKRNSGPPVPPGYPIPGAPPAAPPGYGQPAYGQPGVPPPPPPGYGQPGVPPPPPPGYGQPAAPGYEQPPAYGQPAPPGYEQPPPYAPPAAPGYEPTPTPAAGQPAYPPPPPTYEQPAAPTYEAPPPPPPPAFEQPAAPAYEAPPPPPPPAFEQPAAPAYEAPPPPPHPPAVEPDQVAPPAPDVPQPPPDQPA